MSDYSKAIEAVGTNSFAAQLIRQIQEQDQKQKKWFTEITIQIKKDEIRHAEEAKKERRQWEKKRQKSLPTSSHLIMVACTNKSSVETSP